MDWENVYTTSQREKLITLTLGAYRRFAELPPEGAEIGIAGIYGDKCDKLVMKGGQLLEKYWSFDSSQFRYRPVEVDRSLIIYYRLTPKHFEEAGKSIAARRREKEKTDKPKEHGRILQELKSLCVSRAAKELIRPVELCDLVLTSDGLYEKTIMGNRPIPEDAYLDAIRKYGLTLDDINLAQRRME